MKSEDSRVELDRLRRRLLAGHAVVFLDLDGVCNGTDALARRRAADPHASVFWLDPACVRELDTLCFVCDAVVVLTTSWRDARSVANLEAELHAAGFSGLALDATPDFGAMAQRPAEVRAWLDRHPTVDRWVVLDDEDDGHDPAHFVPVNATSGLTARTRLAAAQVLAPAPPASWGWAVTLAPTHCFACDRPHPTSKVLVALGPLFFCNPTACLSRYFTALADARAAYAPRLREESMVVLQPVKCSVCGQWFETTAPVGATHCHDCTARDEEARVACDVATPPALAAALVARARGEAPRGRPVRPLHRSARREGARGRRRVVRSAPPPPERRARHALEEGSLRGRGRRERRGCSRGVVLTNGRNDVD